MMTACWLDPEITHLDPGLRTSQKVFAIYLLHRDHYYGERAISRKHGHEPSSISAQCAAVHVKHRRGGCSLIPHNATEQKGF